MRCVGTHCTSEGKLGRREILGICATVRLLAAAGAASAVIQNAFPAAQSLLRSVQIDSSFIVGSSGYFGAFWNNRL